VIESELFCTFLPYVRFYARMALRRANFVILMCGDGTKYVKAQRRANVVYVPAPRSATANECHYVSCVEDASEDTRTRSLPSRAEHNTGA